MTARKPRKSARKVANRTPPDEFKRLILAYVTAHGPSLLADIGAAISLTRPTANKYAMQLCADGLMHFTLGEPRNGGREHIYHAGAKVADKPQQEEYRATVKAWSPMRIADPCALPREFFRCGVSV